MVLKSKRFASIRQLQDAELNSPAMRRGAMGDGVRALQQALVDLGYSMPKSLVSGSPDGVFGAETEDCVVAFQVAEGLEPDGKVGYWSMTALDGKFLHEHTPPKVPKPELFEYQVPGRIRRVDQTRWFGGNSLCWAAALTMMFQWRDQVEYSTRDLLDTIGWKFRVLFETNSVMPSGWWYDLIRGAKMGSYQATSMSARDWNTLLRRHGALWVGAMSGLSSYAYGHSFVMHGLTVSPMGTQHVRLINPYRAIDDNRDFEDFTQCFEDAKKASYPQIRFFEYHG